MNKQCSELFIETFDDNSGGVLRTCDCGITYFDETSPECFDVGELENLVELSLQNPKKYKAVDHSIGLIDIGKNKIVIGCTCNIARNYENFIINNAVRISQYLRARSRCMIEQANLINL